MYHAAIRVLRRHDAIPSLLVDSASDVLQLGEEIAEMRLLLQVAQSPLALEPQRRSFALFVLLGGHPMQGCRRRTSR